MDWFDRRLVDIDHQLTPVTADRFRRILSIMFSTVEATLSIVVELRAKFIRNPTLFNLSMWPIYASVLCIGMQLIFRIAVNANSPTTCLTPFYVLSDQIPLEDCQPLMQMIRKYGENMPALQRKFLNMSFINFEERIVCCDAEFDEERAFKSVGTEILRNEALRCGDKKRKRIAFGTESTFLSHPWSVLLMYHLESIFQCGGTLITNRYVLTAAHCIIPALFGVRLGEHKISTDVDCELDEQGQTHCAAPVLDVSIEKMIKHPDYTTVSNGKNIALLRLDRYIELTSSVRNICIPEQNQEFDKEYGTISGWGITENGTQADVNMEAIVPIISSDSCQAVYRRLVFDNTKICTRDVDGQETCDGDSGGPLILGVEGHLDDPVQRFRYVQVGIISSGHNKCGSKRNFPAIYTKIAAFVDWIAFSIEL